MRATMYGRILWSAALLGLALLLPGCDGGDDGGGPAPQGTFEVELTNLSANQPLSPPAALLHGSGFTAWRVGEAAGAGLERLAEGGETAAFLEEARSDPGVRDSAAGQGAVMPGGTSSLMLSGALGDAALTVATMLVNSNDAFTGVTGHALSALRVGESLTLELGAYDAGTEANSESAAGVPGPAAGGEGVNPVRDDRGFVAVHPGVISADDGLIGSALDQSHRILNPVALLVVTRIE